MKYICTHCRRPSEDGNLWCEAVDCPVGAQPLFLRHGDRLGEVRIVGLVRLLRGATLYRAQRDQEWLYVKVANPDPRYETYLKREAAALYQVSQRSQRHPALPLWRAHDDSPDVQPYAYSVFDGKPRTYFLMSYTDADFLSDVLLDQTQFWYRHAAWYALALAEALSQLTLANENKIHANLNPDNLMVTWNNAGVPQPFIVDFGLQLMPNTMLNPKTRPVIQSYLSPAYTPPEIAHTQGAVGPMTDTWLLGTILYRLLAGEDPYQPHLRNTADVYADIVRTPLTLHRNDLTTTESAPEEAQQLVKLTQTLLQIDPKARRFTVNDVANTLRKLFGRVKDKRQFEPARFADDVSVGCLALVVSMTLIIVFLMVMLAFLAPDIQINA